MLVNAESQNGLIQPDLNQNIITDFQGQRSLQALIFFWCERLMTFQDH